MPKKFDQSLIPDRPNLQFEAEVWTAGIVYVAGVDEAGRGALAGPVAAAAVILPPAPAIFDQLHGVRDSKQMTPRSRDHWAERIVNIALSHGVGFADAQEIDEIGILPATRLAVQRALDQLKIQPQYLLLDYLELPERSTPSNSLVKGDRRCLSIAAASVLAKTSRDATMRQLDNRFPGYGFGTHKGYGTQSHRQAVQRLGLCPVHRHSFQFKQV